MVLLQLLLLSGACWYVDSGSTTADGSGLTEAISATSSTVGIASTTSAATTIPTSSLIATATTASTSIGTGTTSSPTYSTTAVNTQTTTTAGWSTDVPQVTSVTLLGPTVINRLWIEFYCAITTSANNSDARFVVQFKFNGVTALTVNSSSLNVTLHEKYLHGNLGTSLQCVVQSFWVSNPSNISSPQFSASYSLSITPNVSSFSVRENDVTPQFFHLQYPLPITCHDAVAAAGATPCYLAVDIQAANDIAVYQAGVPTPQSCKYLLMEGTERQNSVYFNASQPLAVIAKSDPYFTGLRSGQITFKVSNLPLKTAGGYNYTSIWSNLILAQSTVYRYDSDGSVLTCTATADVHYQTFDGLYYSSYGSGSFIYSRSTAGTPFEFQARQSGCYNPTDPITCVCGVAMRENRAVLILDGCQRGVLRAIGYNHHNLPKDSGIFAGDSGYSFKIQMPSGNKVYIDYWGTIMNIRLVVVGRPQIQGMCGSPDGNSDNDLIIQGKNITEPLEWGQAAAAVIDSWRPERGKSLFEGYLKDLPTGEINNGGVVVPPVSTYPICSNATSISYNYPGDPSRPVTALSPSKVSASVASRRRRRDVDTTVVDTDDQYDPSNFTYQDNTTLVELTWPTTTNITREEANATCWSLIVNVTNIGPSCIDILKNSAEEAQGVVAKCVSDVQLTSDYSWARDKVAELQKSCFFIAITKDNSGISDPNEAIQQAVSDVQQVTDFACVPFDCNRRGRCVNGTCICDADFIGADCNVAQSEPPILRSLLTPTDCSVRTQTCSAARLTAENAASVPTLACQINVTLTNSSRLSFNRMAQINLAPTVTCSLPTEPLNLTAAKLDFLSVQPPGNNFDNLPRGSPVSTYSITVSNNGIDFSSDSLTMRVIDTLCMQCTGASATTCTQLGNTCLINGYCFANGIHNPYNIEQTCQPAVSSSRWTNLSGSSSSGNCRRSTHVLILASVAFGILRH